MQETCEYCGGTGVIEVEAYEGLCTCPECEGKEDENG